MKVFITNRLCLHEKMKEDVSSTPQLVPKVLGRPEYTQNMGVEPKIGGKNPKWMVKIMENPIKMDDLGGFPLFLETPT